MAKIKVHALCRNLLPSALVLMEKEYAKPDRVKLTHFWLAQELGIERVVAFHLLIKVAKMKKFCVQMPTGPIYWDNHLMNVGDIMQMFADATAQNENARTQHQS